MELVNIGYNPTLKQEMSLEVHILDFDREVYGEKIVYTKLLNS